jgi:hypothetical protein
MRLAKLNDAENDEQNQRKASSQTPADSALVAMLILPISNLEDFVHGSLPNYLGCQFLIGRAQFS